MSFQTGDRIKDKVRDKCGVVLSSSPNGMVLVVEWDNGQTGTVDANDCTTMPKTKRR